MSDSSHNNPPRGDFEKAEKYINQLVNLINSNKLEVYHTDLKKFDPGALQDHYVLNLKDYQIEISHSKQPNTGKDSFVMVFNNLKNIAEGSSSKAILAYTFLADSQFAKFKMVAQRQIEDRRRAAEDKRFREALQPVDELLEKAVGGGLEIGVKTEQTTEKENSSKPAESFIETPQIHQI